MTTLRVVLFRHGPAGKRDPSRWPDDDLRPLTSKGEARTRASAAGLARLTGEVRAIWTSPLPRAAATAALLHEAVDDARVTTVDALRPRGSWRDLIERLQHQRGAGGTIVLVGHEPDLGKLAGILVFGAPRALPLKKAGAAAIEFAGPVESGEGTIAWWFTPRLLRSRARKRRREKAG
jgi:phosphohistidine phosphatase